MLSSCSCFYRKDMEAAKEKNRKQRKKGSETRSCCLPDPLLCRGYKAVILLPRKLKSKWCLSAFPLQLRPHRMIASHRHKQKRCRHFQRNVSSLLWSASFLCHRWSVHSASPSACCQGSKCYVVPVSDFPPFPAPLKWKEWEEEIQSKAKIKW